jgi:ATP adenylyltransferase
MNNGRPLAARSCVYCTGLANKAEPQAVVWDRPLAQTDDLLVVPSKGSLVPGWLLVVPRKHSLCAGAMSLAKRNALFDAAIAVSEVIGQAFGRSATVFEHGPAAHGDLAGCGINHTHLHVVPLGFSLTARASETAGIGAWSGASLEDLGSSHAGALSYLAVIEPDRELRLAEPVQPTSQVLRRVIAAEVGFPERWDYRVFDGAVEVAETVRRLSAFRAQLQDAVEAAVVAA